MVNSMYPSSSRLSLTNANSGAHRAIFLIICSFGSVPQGFIEGVMRICLVSSFPPSHERLNEYGFHLATELQRNPCLSLTVLADEFDGASELPEFNVVRCWKPNDLSTPLRLMKKFREFRPDVVWFNTVFSSFGTTPPAAFIGLCTPALARASGFSTHVTLHHLMESLDLRDVGIRHAALYHLGGAAATRLLLLANSVTVLLPAYRRTLIQKYRGKNVHFRAHGIFAGTPQYPDFSRRGNPEHRILAFGKWGTYKRLEILLEVFNQVAKEVSNCRLVIAGENHPSAPGYVEGVAARVKDDPRITVRGYVPEEDIADLFSSATLLVMPYNSATGSSGVAHQACQFGVPILCADIPEFRDMADEERIAMQFYRRGDHDSFTYALVSLLQDGEMQREMAEQNFHAAMRMTMPQIVRQYLRAFDWQRRPRMSLLRTRLGRVLPAWSAYPAGASILPPSPALVPIVTRTETKSDPPLAA
jgi:glycosyltransferase involved in cell wall biosynthesis